MPDYSAAVLDHFRRATGAGLLDPGQPRFGTATVGTVKSGVKVVFQLGLSADGRVDRVGWLAFGCPSTIACCSWFAEALPGCDVATAEALLHDQVMQALAVARDVRARVLVVEDAALAALRMADQESERTR
ncbi:iron-sulfur cluster assembly scaffold protein [Methylonatrum kenyense]|uniref:iron-sulfur cluster assembly scaffold protein n=1 Tax=Methylonatrum kenyense TaxID=455253 RepID=UPI0020BE33C1|nr:iron-sulfur cluster assembly scaffold protein [Methylonatrum kenyense]